MVKVYVGMISVRSRMRLPWLDRELEVVGSFCVSDSERVESGILCVSLEIEIVLVVPLILYESRVLFGV